MKACSRSANWTTCGPLASSPLAKGRLALGIEADETGAQDRASRGLELRWRLQQMNTIKGQAGKRRELRNFFSGRPLRTRRICHSLHHFAGENYLVTCLRLREKRKHQGADYRRNRCLVEG
jgi:hypothetical protein